MQKLPHQSTFVRVVNQLSQIEPQRVRDIEKNYKDISMIQIRTECNK